MVMDRRPLPNLDVGASLPPYACHPMHMHPMHPMPNLDGGASLLFRHALGGVGSGRRRRSVVRGRGPAHVPPELLELRLRRLHLLPQRSDDGERRGNRRIDRVEHGRRVDLRKHLRWGLLLDLLFGSLELVELFARRQHLFAALAATVALAAALARPRRRCLAARRLSRGGRFAQRGALTLFGGGRHCTYRDRK